MMAWLAFAAWLLLAWVLLSLVIGMAAYALGTMCVWERQRVRRREFFANLNAATRCK